jgi:hypothetical protein
MELFRCSSNRFIPTRDGTLSGTRIGMGLNAAAARWQRDDLRGQEKLKAEAVDDLRGQEKPT